jgi:hypothetical protein
MPSCRYYLLVAWGNPCRRPLGRRLAAAFYLIESIQVCVISHINTNAEHDLLKIAKYIEEFEDLYDSGDIDNLNVNKYQKKLNKIADMYNIDDFPSDGVYVLYEFYALILLAENNNELAETNLRTAKSLKPNYQHFMSRAAQNWDAQNIVVDNKYRFKTILKNYWFWIVSIVIFLNLIYPPLHDAYLLNSESQEIHTLAIGAGLNKNGETILLRNHPELVDREKLNTVCESDSNTDATFIEQGCFLNNHIYIARLGTDFTSLEAVIAAHEMLHAAYQESPSLDKEIEEYASTITDKTFTERMAKYEDLEPGARVNELHSIVGTEFGNLPPELESYYSKYFNNRNEVVGANENALGIFTSLNSQLDDLINKLKSAKNDTDDIYNQHVYAAQSGNASSADYYYDLYSQRFNEAKSYYDQAMEISNKIDYLAAEFNGSALPSFEPLHLAPQ